jgi:hypothetical protein
MQQLSQTVISQYDSDPVTDALVASFGQAINPDYLFEQFYSLIWNALDPNNTSIDPTSTIGYGLDVWGRIVGVGRVVTGNAGPFLGFSNNDTSEASGNPFGFGIFYNGENTTENFTLTNQSYRLLILAKAAANITGDSVPEINQILLNLFPNRGNCYVQDNQDMTLTYTFTFPLQPAEIAIVQNSGVLPTPTGVNALYSYPS